MKRFAAVLSVLAILGVAGAAHADDEETGRIKEIDADEGKIVLLDGSKFKVDDDVSLDDFEEGDQVSVSYEEDDDDDDDDDDEWRKASSVEHKSDER